MISVANLKHKYIKYLPAKKGRGGVVVKVLGYRQVACSIPDSVIGIFQVT